MKLVIAIVNQEDTAQVTHSLNRAGYSSTRFASQGSFLLQDNTTFLIGVDEDRVEEAKRIVKSNVQRHQRPVGGLSPEHYGYPVEDAADVTVGGVTMFVLDVEQFERS